MQTHRVITFAVVLAGLLGGCTRNQPSADTKMPTPAYPKIVFLSREGCVNTPRMRKSLDVAVAKLGWPKQYEVLDAGKLPASDPRRQYGTPTVLVDGKDLMGHPVPRPSDAEPG